MTELHIVFDGPPGPEAGRFVEVETPSGRSVRAGRWIQRDKYWVLILTPHDFPDRPRPMTDLEKALSGIEEHLKAVRDHDLADARDIQEIVDRIRLEAMDEEAA